MYDFVILIILVVFVLLIIGFFNPNKSLFWFKGERTKKKSFIIYFISLIVLNGLSVNIKPQSVIDEEKKEQEELVQQKKIEEEELIKQKKIEELNRVYLIDDCNDFKDNTGNYKGLKIEDKFYYNSGVKLRVIIEQTKKYTKQKFVPITFYHFDKNINQCNIEVMVPIDIEVPNIVTRDEEVILNFTCTKGELDEGNIVNSIVRYKKQ